MSNYNIAVSWSGKDALSDSDADKVISGGDFNTEFLAVKTAVNSKAELNGSASETFSAITAASGTSTTQVATTAFVDTATSAAAYPVGAIFTTVTAYADSAAVVTAIGGTTWVAFAAGKMLIGLDSGDTDFDTVEQTGGAKTHTLTIDEMPAHTHGYEGHLNIHPGATDGGSAQAPTAKTSDSTGGGTAHSIMNPYIAVYMWKRTA